MSANESLVECKSSIDLDIAIIDNVNIIISIAKSIIDFITTSFSIEFND
jgi:hypothetical protein